MKYSLLGPLGNPDKWSAYEEALHFPAMECPSLLAKDIHAFFESVAGTKLYAWFFWPVT